MIVFRQDKPFEVQSARMSLERMLMPVYHATKEETLGLLSAIGIFLLTLWLLAGAPLPAPEPKEVRDQYTPMFGSKIIMMMPKQHLTATTNYTN